MSPKLTFAISGISYLSVLLASFLLPIFHQLPRAYCWFLVPLVANFFIGYFAAELHTALKVVITFLLLHIVMVIMVIGLLWTSLFYGTLTPYSPEDDPFAVITLVILVYSLMNIIFGVVASSIGTIVRGYTGQLKKLLSAKE
ncbi:MAG: hypothetical protein PVF15_01600 [Candidatus Bathyarchaeota archaeon]|jgi:hypothetical protein